MLVDPKIICMKSCSSITRWIFYWILIFLSILPGVIVGGAYCLTMAYLYLNVFPQEPDYNSDPDILIDGTDLGVFVGAIPFLCFAFFSFTYFLGFSIAFLACNSNNEFAKHTKHRLKPKGIIHIYDCANFLSVCLVIGLFPVFCLITVVMLIIGLFGVLTLSLSTFGVGSLLIFIIPCIPIFIFCVFPFFYAWYILAHNDDGDCKKIMNLKKKINGNNFDLFLKGLKNRNFYLKKRYYIKKKPENTSFFKIQKFYSNDVWSEQPKIYKDLYAKVLSFKIRNEESEILKAVKENRFSRVVFDVKYDISFKGSREKFTKSLFHRAHKNAGFLATSEWKTQFGHVMFISNDGQYPTEISSKFDYDNYGPKKTLKTNFCFPSFSMAANHFKDVLVEVTISALNDYKTREEREEENELKENKTNDIDLVENVEEKLDPVEEKLDPVEEKLDPVEEKPDPVEKKESVEENTENVNM